MSRACVLPHSILQSSDNRYSFVSYRMSFLDRLINPSDANPSVLLNYGLATLFVFNEIWSRHGVPSRHCRRFPDGQSLTFSSAFSTRKLSAGEI